LCPSLYKLDKHVSSRATLEIHNKEEALMGGEEKESLIKAMELFFSSNFEEYFCRETQENYLQTFYLSRKSFYVFTGHLYIPNQIIRWLSDFRGTSRNPWISV
jgi:hypothetical protein